MKNPKTEIRNPKENRIPNSESKRARGNDRAKSDFEVRISFGFRPSDFGFPVA
jgi:hypothetical protein